MTREETKEFVRHHPSLKDKADNWNWLIDKIYDDFEAQMKAKDEEIALLKSTLSAYAMLKD